MKPIAWLKQRTRRKRDLEEDETKVREGFWRKLGRNLGRVPFVDDLVAAYFAAFDPKTPASAKAILIGALIYFIMPADIIPDVLIGTGFLDDASVLAYALATTRKHLLPSHYARARRALAKQPVERLSAGTARWQEAGH
ncbi:MAG: YkvA family protein [Alphaproteobacteria bacterium]|jgi:uncharacterized membrane protein YkvA (DUF1232 family)|nr:DUF1232 domain-containing protein [Rhodospirillaceae bacterium]MDG2480135.1 YkvA family protein [Alphaproteobacteria bacterium]MBT6205303.1 DUF1232 domain-containing protein [Rhodospirillaceae bacterium]MBT6512638.1 DUF1232 domain-containing protein [Rhodospirillaceae bacterium]MBT7614098.1 DUF1232 domain-containing protein [Rhodospirillaceae bacterium]